MKILSLLLLLLFITNHIDYVYSYQTAPSLAQAILKKHKFQINQDVTHADYWIHHPSQLNHITNNNNNNNKQQNIKQLSDPVYHYETKYFTQVLDHTKCINSFTPSTPTQTFQQRYLINDTFWTKPDANGENAGPIFFYTGNEGPIDLFANNTGFMWDIASEFGALLLFVEHRYYGESLPFGTQTYQDPTHQTLIYLSAEQALADYAVFLTQFKQDWNIPHVPVIAFGGSYGGMLAAWFRYKYSHVVVGAIASSAPIWQFTGATPSTSYNEIVTRDFANAGPNCVPAIRKSWNIMSSMNDRNGLNTLSNIFHLCSPLQNVEQVTNDLFNLIVGALTTMPMVDYPYPTSFLGPMPAYPVSVACSFFNQSDPSNTQILQSLYQAINVYYNYSGQAGPCFNLTMSTDPTLADDGGWNYQSCTEMVMPIGQDNIHDMLFYAPWNLTTTIIGCNQSYSTIPRPDWILTYYGSPSTLPLSGISNVVFPNGNLDPWSGGGVLNNPSWSDSIITYLIDGGAHHLDLRSSNPLDPQSVITARQIHKDNIKKWINEYNNGQGSSSSSSSSLSRGAVVGITVAVTVACTVLVMLLVMKVCGVKTSSGYRAMDSRA